MINIGYNYAVVGFSQDPAKYGQIVFNDLKCAGFKVFPVNMRGGKYEGQDVAKSLSDIEEKIDVVVFVVPPQVGIKVLPELKELKIKKAWFQPGSGSEEIAKWCEENGVECVDACIMVERKSS